MRPVPPPGKIFAVRPGAKMTMAAAADRHRCYEASVQAVDAEIDFVDATFKDLRGRKAKTIREDFCGTANSSCEWVRRRPTNRAIGVDFDGPTLQWARDHSLSHLKAAARNRIRLVRADVTTVKTDPVDAVLAMNFSYYTFKTRDMMRSYFANVRKALSPDGLFFLDCYGGSDAFREMTEKRKITKDLTYVWDQIRFAPITGEIDCAIHFHFRDGSKMVRAFEYSWRMWTLPEIRELLAEAGFRRSTVYWEGTEEDTGEGDGEFTPNDLGEADLAWIAYIVAER
jgi:SAM-dependent methyltransferase